MSIIYIVEWTAPAVQNRPSPCGVVTFTRISDHRAIMFGGSYQNVRSDDLFIFDLEHKVCIFTYIRKLKGKLANQDKSLPNKSV